ncbi:LysM peptidoglycan-binding domain-containing protein [Microbacterium luticocti]|uniref:LysM peptidoglycan-binding domain-containing protein n=1 Tax=Microbacterium luticocti TaxID=451764 RepID=UPI00068458EA
MPAAIAGSLALSLSAAPAHAAEPAPADLGGHVPHRAHDAAATGPLTVAQLSAALAASSVVHDAAAHAGALAHAALPAARRAPATYRIVRGDTVSAIAARYGLRTADVLGWNGLGWSTIIYPGQVLRLRPPAGASAKPAAAPAPARAAPKAKAKPAPAKAKAPSTARATYTVRRGDTVSAIARRYGQSTQAVLNANGLRWSSIIYPGQKLVIPGTAAAKPAPKPAPAPAAAPAPKPAPAPAASGTVSPGDAYTVRAGDTMSAIASRHGVSVTALLAANKMDWSSIIYPGQRITIPTSGVPGLTTEQAANARLIVRVGRALGVPDRGIAIALGTAMQESGLRNLDYGDRDSLGLFQQRPSTGWGTAAQVRDAERSIRVFFGGPSDPNGTRTRGLLDVPGWQSMGFADAAQAVQISAYPSLYAQWEKPAYAWLAAIG